ncbi:MAG: hypothetical protein QOD02_424 [Mycobacterium sp.]|nr:hypothetical protein [Mycobacterium sp.]
MPSGFCVVFVSFLQGCLVRREDAPLPGRQSTSHSGSNTSRDICCKVAGLPSLDTWSRIGLPLAVAVDASAAAPLAGSTWRADGGSSFAC